MPETVIGEVPVNQNAQPVEFQSTSVPEDQSTVDQNTTSHHDPSAVPENDETKSTNTEDDQEFLRRLPPEIGTLLVMVGIAGLLLPGVIGTPLIVAGAVVIWPKTFEPLERRFAKNYPESHRKGIRQVKRFIQDLNNRFPES